METTFYEDSRYRGGAEVVGRGAAMKRPATLDLNCRSSKKPRGNTLLTSPDLRMLKLESPELEKLIIQQHGILQQPNQCMYPKAADDNRDPYARGDFPDALGGLQHQQPQSNYNLYQQPQGNLQQEDVTHLVNGCNALPPTSMPSSTLVDAYGYHHQQPLSVINGNCPPVVVSSSNNNSCYAPVSNGFYAMEPLVSIKEEPQTVPCASPHDPPRSPIDMEDQERLKLERKRLRNRIAASKCRRRKLERIARLEDKVAHLKSENAELANHVTRLKEHVCQLKQQVMEHVRSGCEILVAPSYPPYPEDL